MLNVLIKTYINGTQFIHGFVGWTRIYISVTLTKLANIKNCYD